MLILSDINMPGMNGLDLLRAVKVRHGHLKVYMITAYSDEANRRRRPRNTAATTTSPSRSTSPS